MSLVARPWFSALICALFYGAAPGALAQAPSTGERAQAPAPQTGASAAARPQPRAGGGPRLVLRGTSLPASGLFEGDQLSPAARRRLDALLADAGDIDVEFAFVAPSGAWQTDGPAAGERSLTPARLQALRDHLARRGIDARRIYIENRIDPQAAAARLDIELLGRPAPQ